MELCYQLLLSAYQFPHPYYEITKFLSYQLLHIHFNNYTILRGQSAVFRNSCALNTYS